MLLAHQYKYNTFGVMITTKKKYKLWKDKNLHDKNADEDQAGAGDVVFEGRQCCCSVLEKQERGQSSPKDIKATSGNSPVLLDTTSRKIIYNISQEPKSPKNKL